jgi:hypothetical protein
MDYLTFYSQHVKGLQKAGRNYLGYCPFHPDEGSKRRGFSLNPDDGIWYCFSCKKGGNTVAFCREKGIPVREAPDYDAKFTKYAYAGGVYKRKNKQGFSWEGTQGTLPDAPYNPQAIDLAREEQETLWICEGEKDTLTMLEAGALAIGIPSFLSSKVLDNISIADIPEIIIACDNDEAGKKAMEKVLQRFPFALVVEWPEDKQEGYDVTDLYNDEGDAFVNLLRLWAVRIEPFKPLAAFLAEKRTRDEGRDPDKLLGYNLVRFSKLAQNIDGVQPGLYVIGAPPSAGKTSFLCSLTLDLLETNEGLVGMYFSLDDNKNTIANRFLSILSHIPINQVQRPQKVEGFNNSLDAAYQRLQGWASGERLFIRDASEIQHFEDLERAIKQRIQQDLFVVIDDLHNLESGYSGGTKKKDIERIDRIKALSAVHDIPILCSAALGKVKEGTGTAKNPSILDIRETGKFASNANAFLLLYPEDGEAYEQSEESVLKLQYAKNKLSNYRKVDTLKFYRQTSRVVELW